jgi:hypothetical protein
MGLRKRKQILAIASLSSPQFNANPFLRPAVLWAVFRAFLLPRRVVAMAPEPPLWDFAGYSNQVCSFDPACDEM